MFFKLFEFINFNPGKRDRIVVFNFVFCLLVNIALWVMVIIVWRSIGKSDFSQSGAVAVLRYNIYFGISALGFRHFMLLIPLAGFIVLVINFLLALKLYLNHKILSYFLVSGASVMGTILLVAGAVLAYVNI